MKPPRKYLDKARTQVNPDWFEWRDEQSRTEIAFQGPGSFEAYFPDEVGKEIPDGGCWIRVLVEPFTEMRSRFRVPLQSMWRAHRHEMQAGERWGLRPQLARIVTPAGDLCLWPHEYQIVPDITQYVGMEPDVEMHTLGGEPLFKNMEEQLFYIQSRGISRHEAALLLLNDIDAPGFCYFTLHPDLVEFFKGVGVPLWLHMDPDYQRDLEDA